jgi:far upstream element-binding protein
MPTIDDVYKKVGIDAVIDETMMTPYGPPSALAYIMPVPDDIVGLIIGKGGETIRQLQLESGAKIQVAIKPVESTMMRNVFVEGPDDKYRKAKEMIDEIIRNQKQTSTPQVNVAVADINPFITHANKSKVYRFEVPDKMVGLVIGKSTETLKSIALRSNTRIFVPQKNTDNG